MSDADLSSESKSSDLPAHKEVPHPADIFLWQDRYNQDPNPYVPEIVTSPTSLERKLAEYLDQLNYSRDHVLVILSHLLVDGKVLVTGVRGPERLALVSLADRVPTDDARIQIQTYLEAHYKNGKAPSPTSEPEKKLEPSINEVTPAPIAATANLAETSTAPTNRNPRPVLTPEA